MGHFITWLESSDRPEDIERAKQEYTLLHTKAGIPLEYRRYWMEPRDLLAMGIQPPPFVKIRGYDRRPVPLPDLIQMSKVSIGILDLGYIIGQSGQGMGWIFVKGKDQSGRAAWVVAIPPPESMKYKASLDRVLGVSPNAQQMPGPEQISANKNQMDAAIAEKKRQAMARPTQQPKQGLFSRFF